MVPFFVCVFSLLRENGMNALRDTSERMYAKLCSFCPVLWS